MLQDYHWNMLEKIKEQVRKECSDSSFKHHTWYWDFHILPVLDVALKLAEKYPVDKEVIELSVYLHDIGKIRGLDDHATTGAKIAAELLKDHPKKDLIVECVAKHNGPSEDDRIEIKLIAAADAIGHLLSPFNEIYFWENPDKDIRDIMAGNLKKAEKDWERILLPEGKEMARGEMDGLKKRYRTANI